MHQASFFQLLDSLYVNIIMPSFIVHLIVSRKTRTGSYQIVSNHTGPYLNHFEYHPEIDLKSRSIFRKSRDLEKTHYRK